MTDSTDTILHAIEIISSAASLVDASVNVRSNQPADQSTTEGVIAAIEEVTAAVAAQRLAPKDQQMDADVVRAIHEVSYQWVSRATPLDLTDVDRSLAVLSCLGQSHNENLHSDYIAALLNPAVSGHLATRLFLDLFALGVDGVELSPDDVRDQRTYRERHLYDIDLSTSLSGSGARRIDILTETERAVLVIENKIYASESESQTEDYVAAVTNRYERRELSFIFLSPTGMRAQAPEFREVSYLDLFAVLNRVRDAGPWTDVGTRLLETYLSEVAVTFCKPELALVERITPDLRKAGYDV